MSILSIFINACVHITANSNDEKLCLEKILINIIRTL